MATEFEILQALTQDHVNGLPGVVLTTFNDEGIISSKGLGKRTRESEEVVSIDDTFFAFSCTKLLTTISALQCVERGLIGLDDEVQGVLPELAGPMIISEEPGLPFKLTPAKTQITLRHLLTHTSGISYDLMHPILMAWRKSRNEPGLTMSGKLVESFSLPLLFEPGSRWVYGGSLDWAGLLVGRLNGNITLSEYMEEHIFKPLGMTSTAFRLTDRSDIKDRLIQMVMRTPDGSLTPMSSPFPADARDDIGGSGMITSTSDFVKVLIDLLRDSPVLLKTETIAEMFTPQFDMEDPRYEGLVAQSNLHFNLTGVEIGGRPQVVFGLGSLVVQGDVPNLPENTLTWNGMPNMGWSINREKKLGSMYTTQTMPPGDSKSVQLIGAFLKDFWKKQ